MWITLLLMVGAAVAAPASHDSTTYPRPEALRGYVQARMLEEAGELDAALEEYYRVVAADPYALGALRRISDLDAQRGEPARSLEFAERALALDPTDARSLWLKGSALFNMDRTTDALTALQNAVSLDPDQPDYWRTLARAGERTDRLDLVTEACEHLIDIDDSDPEAWFQLAGARARLGQFAGADSALAQARDLNPVRPGTDFLQGWIDEGLGRDDDAIQLYTHHLSVHPDDSVTRQRLVTLLAGRGRYSDAYTQARRVREANPRDPEAFETEADLAFRVGQPQAAHDRLAELCRLDPEDPQLVLRSAAVLVRNKRGAEGVALSTQWAEKHPGDFRGSLLLARAQAMNGQLEPALITARAAVSAAPESLGARMTLARIAQQGRHWVEAAEAWARVHEARPRDVAVSLDLALCREQIGDVDGAVSVAREALAVSPSDATVLNFLGYLLADHDRDLEQARGLIQQAVAQEPDNGAFIDSLGWVYYRLGQLSAAREQLERAVRLTRGDPVVLEHLGDVYRDLRLLDLAREQYRRSLAADRSNLRVRNKLEALR
jgi:tetratricopeptide (TPR) repeat protein